MKSLVVVLLLTSTAYADDDGYCDYVEGVANSQAAILFAPELIGTFGYVEQPPQSASPSQTTELRLIAGVRYSLSNVYTGFATRERAHADCRRHKAFEQVRGETSSRAIAARLKVLDDALVQAEKYLKDDEEDFAAHRTTAQEATSTRVRVEEIRQLAADDHAAMSALPPPSETPLAGALQTYRHADADVEDNEAKLRRAAGVDVSVRFGVDDYPSRSTPSAPYFAVLSVGFNTGILFQGSANARAAAGRRRLVQSGQGPDVQQTVEELRTTLEIESKRAKETEALVGELERQLDALGRIGGEDSKRYKQTVWFEWVKAKAQHEYLVTHVQTIREVLGGTE